MRELMFRAWDKDLAKYLEGCERDSFMADLAAEGEGRDIVIEQICPARYTIEQYTGLTISDGTKIFEGDILYLWVDELVGVVEWNDEGAEYWLREIKSVHGVAKNTFTLIDPQIMKVIGNIHENKELLEVEDE